MTDAVLIPPPPLMPKPPARQRFVALALEQLGKPVLWASKGPDSFDCSGLTTWCLKQVGGPDLTQVDNAQALHNALPDITYTTTPLPGDLIFYAYGSDASKNVEHVAIWLAGAKCISADGATSHITTLAEALKHPDYRVRLHDDIHFRHDLPAAGNPISICRFTLLDAVDGICV